ncbi:MAG TPA: RluA family pseudouridine synthase [Acidimicrobiales bacterium]|nr:RluA family pseudouridine synthase [Acidimicrobiales bacterium]
MREALPPALAGERLDRVVAMLTGTSRSGAAALVDQGGVTLDGEVVTNRSLKVDEGAVVEVEVPEPVPDLGLVPDPSIVVPVIHEDADLLVVDKPAGLVVHPGAGQSGGTMVHGLLARYPEIAQVGQADRPGVVHRIDKGTSGLLLVARSQPAYEALVAMLAAHDVDRRYRALVWGRVEAPTGMVDAPIGRSQRDRTRMAVTMRGREAVTRYEVLHRFDHPVIATELACTLDTGRTHQIRVHMASIGHAVVGDERYGGQRATLPLRRQWLHAEHLGLDHPVTGERLAFDSALPDDLAASLDTLVAQPAPTDDSAPWAPGGAPASRTLPASPSS